MMSLADKSICTGCTACAESCPNHCIHMEQNRDGFMYPETVSPEKCTDCGICKSVCPIMNKPRKSADTKGYAAYCKDEDIRSISSSGGIFSALALDILKEGGAVFGASYDSRFKVMHICVDNEDDLAKLRGAKYAQSYLGSTYLSVKKLLNEGKKVIFSGSPCQVAGLKSFLRKDYENLICIDFVCHGVPSPKVWDKYVEYRANTDNKGKLPKSINLRSKKTGWSRYRYSTEFNYGDKLFSHINTGDIFMRLFIGAHIIRPACTACQFKGYDRESDITIGDFWGIWDIDPSMDDNKGTSVILTHGESGEKLLEKIEHRLVIKQVTLEQTSMQNPAMHHSAKMNSERDKYLEFALNGEFDIAEKQLDKAEKKKTSLMAKGINRFRSFIGG